MGKIVNTFFKKIYKIVVCWSTMQEKLFNLLLHLNCRLKKFFLLYSEIYDKTLDKNNKTLYNQNSMRGADLCMEGNFNKSL